MAPYKHYKTELRDLKIMYEINVELIRTCIQVKEEEIIERDRVSKVQLMKLNKDILTMENEVKRLIKINSQVNYAITRKDPTHRYSP